MEDVEEDHKWNKHQKVLGQRGTGSQMEELSTPLSETFSIHIMSHQLLNNNPNPSNNPQNLNPSLLNSIPQQLPTVNSSAIGITIPKLIN
jgi:hypothetical protein